MAAGELNETRNNLFAEPAALVRRQQRDIANVGAVDAIRQSPSYANQPPVVIHQQNKATVGKGKFKRGCILGTQWRSTIERSKLFPIDTLDRLFPEQGHAVILQPGNISGR